MKRILMVALATLFLAAQGVAQGPQKQMTPEQREARKQAMMENRCNQLATALTLNDVDAARFIALYKQYNDEMHALRKQYKMHRPKKANAKQGTPAEPLTDEQVDANIRNRFAMSRAIIDVREKYYNEFCQFMNPKQIQKLYDLEKKQGAKMKEQHHQRGPQGAKQVAGRPRPQQR